MAKQLIPENVIRKIDSLGRITLPKGLRDRMFLLDNDELEFFTAMIDDRYCICLTPPLSEEAEVEAAIKILDKYGLQVVEG